MRTLAHEPASAFGVSAFRTVVLPTDYRKSWALLRRIYASYVPDVVVHFGLSGRAEAITIERLGRRACGPSPDAAGYAPRFGYVRRGGSETLASTLCTDELAAALGEVGIPSALSDDAGGYVCNATLYRSLAAAPACCRVGFVHVPPVGSGWTAERLRDAAVTVLRAALSGASPPA